MGLGLAFFLVHIQKSGIIIAVLAWPFFLVYMQKSGIIIRVWAQPFYIVNMQKSALNIWVWVQPFLIVNMQKSLLSLTHLRVAILYCQYSEICIHYKENGREYQRGNQEWTIQRKWQHGVQKTKTNETNTQQNMCWTPLQATNINNASKI